MGSRGDHLDLRVEDDSGESRQVKWWFADESLLPQAASTWPLRCASIIFAASVRR